MRRRAGGWTSSDPALEYATREVLSRQRQPAIKELASDPELRAYVFGLMRLETGDHPETAMENLINRAVMSGKSVRELVFNGGNTGGSFYGPVRRGIVKPEQSGSSYYQKAMAALEDISDGSNHVSLTTDQGMENEHAFADANPGIGGKIKVGNEWFSRKGMDGVRYAQSTQAEIDKRVAELRKSGLPLDFTGPKQAWVDTAPPFAPAGSPEDIAAGVTQRTYTPPPTFWQTVEAAADESTVAYLFRDSPVFAPAPDYKPTLEEMEQRKQGLPEKYWGNLIGVSPEHSDYLTEQAHRQFDNELTMSQAGRTGTAVGLVSSILDPMDLGVAIASGGLGAMAGGAMKLGSMGTRLAAGAAAAGGNVALTAGREAMGRSSDSMDYAAAAAFGAGLGFAFGPFARNPATEDIAARGSIAANKIVAEARRRPEPVPEGEVRAPAASPAEASPTPQTSPGVIMGTPGPSGDLSAAANPSPSIQFSKGDLMGMGQEDASRTAVETLRPDMAGRLGTSKNPLARKIGEALGFDVVGRKGADGEFVVNPVSAGEDKNRIMWDTNHRFYSVADPQFQEWAQARGIPRWKAAGIKASKAGEEFGDLVTAYVRDRRVDRDSFYEPQVVKVGKQYASIMEERRQGNVTPRPETPGNPGRPMPGWESLPPNAHYAPRAWDLHKIASADASGRKFMDWFEGALLASHKELGDKAGTIARGVWENINRRAFGIDEFLMISRDGATADVIKSGLKDLGMNDDDIAEVLARLPAGSKPGFTQMRLDLDETYVHPRSGLQLSDFTETNAFDLFDHYNHQSAAWQAAGRIQIVGRDGEVLRDGIRSRQEISDILEQARARGYEAGQTPKEVANDVSLLKEEFGRLFGVPHKDAGSRGAQLLEIGRNAGNATLAGNFGIAALGDIGRLASIGGAATEGGLRAMAQHMPAFRMHILEGGVLKPSDDLARDIAAMGAPDEIRHLTPRRAAEDGGMTLPMDGALAKIAGATKLASDFVVTASGMPAINHRIRSAARKIMADRVYRDAKEAFGGFNKYASSTRAVREDIKAQLMSAGVHQREAEMNAAIVGAHYTARAERLGMDPLKLYKSEGIDVQSGIRPPEPEPPAPTRPSEPKPPAPPTSPEPKPSSDTGPKKTKGGLGKSMSEISAGMESGDRGYAAVHKAASDAVPRPIEPLGNRILREAVGIANGERDVRVLFKDLHKHLPGIPKADIDKALLQLQREGKVVLYHLDNHRELTPEDDAAAVHISGVTRHLLYVHQETNIPPAPSLMQDVRGSIAFGNGKAAVTLFEGRDASTFMHEMGHQWLRELVQDASRSAEVKKDLGVVLKWLGIDDASKIAPKHHEQWAKGFEQYLREGKAPTPGLRGAFQQFQSWLTRIYMSIKGLGAPISDEVRGVMDRMLASEAASKFDLSKLSQAERDRMKWFGLDDGMLSRVLAQLHEHAEETTHWTGSKLSRLNPDEWSDLEAKTAFASALNRAAGRASMEHDFGAGTVYDRSPIFRTFAQLRRFSLNAWHMNILHGRAMADGETLSDVVFSTMSAAALYAARTRIQAATQEDPQKFLDERMSPAALALATFQLSAYSSLIPDLMDTGVMATGANPIFGYKNSGRPSDLLFGNPSVAFANNMLRMAPSAAAQPIFMGRERSQQEWKQLISVLPFSNNIAVQGALGLMVQGAPKKPPKNAGFNITDFMSP